MASAAVISALTLASVVPAQADEGAEDASVAEYVVAEPTSVESTSVEAVTAEDSVERSAVEASAPGAPQDVTVVLSDRSASISFAAPIEGGVPTLYTAQVLRTNGGGNTLTQVLSSPGTFVFTDLTPGLYAFSLTASNASGSNSMTNYSFVIPDISTPPIIEGYTVTDTGVTFTVRNVNDDLPPQSGPTVRASAVYKLNLDDGINVHEAGGSAIDSAVGYYNFLTPATTYAVTLTVSYFFEGSGWFGPSEAATTTVTTLAADGTETPVEPAAPDSDALTDGVRGGVTVPATGIVGESVTIDVGAEHAGQTLYGWLYSSPVALGAATVAADGTLSFTLPASAETGAHRIALTDAANTVIGWGSIRLTAAGDDSADGSVTDGGAGATTDSDTGVTGSGTVTAARRADGELARTGIEPPVGAALGGVFLLALGAVLVFRRRATA